MDTDQFESRWQTRETVSLTCSSCVRAILTACSPILVSTPMEEEWPGIASSFSGQDQTAVLACAAAKHRCALGSTIVQCSKAWSRKSIQLISEVGRGELKSSELRDLQRWQGASHGRVTRLMLWPSLRGKEPSSEDRFDLCRLKKQNVRVSNPWKCLYRS
eukprot:symbB.v1.2.037984.t1/scaffold5768.1/size23836/1